MTNPTPEALVLSTKIFHEWQERYCREFNLPKYEQPELIHAYALVITEQARDRDAFKGAFQILFNCHHGDKDTCGCRQDARTLIKSETTRTAKKGGTEG